MGTGITNTLIAGTVGACGGCVTAFVTAQLKIRELEQASKISLKNQQNQERGRHQLHYLNPLRVQAEDLRKRLSDVDSRVLRGDPFLRDTIQEIEPKVKGSLEDFAGWANKFGQYALSTVYMTLCYLAGASRIRAELPFVDLGHGGDHLLLQHLNRVRSAIGGDYGIWESLQDSLGHYVRDNEGNLKDYRQFCTDLTGDGGFVWISRVIKFYDHMGLKSAAERQEMCESLADLETFLRVRPQETARGEHPRSGGSPA